MRKGKLRILRVIGKKAPADRWGEWVILVSARDAIRLKLDSCYWSTKYLMNIPKEEVIRRFKEKGHTILSED